MAPERESVAAAMRYLFDGPVAVELAWEDAWSEAMILAEEREIVAQAIGKRRLEFAGGRAAARSALERLGVVGAPILRGPSREPRWPAGFVGSISHARDLSGAAVVAGAYARGLGLDIEVHREMSEGVVEMICRPEEREALAAAGWIDAAGGPRVVFGAKECVHKATFPVTGVTLGFSEVVLSLVPAAPAPGELARGAFRAEPAPGARAAAESARSLSGRFVVTREHVLCSAIWRT